MIYLVAGVRSKSLSSVADKILSSPRLFTTAVIWRVNNHGNL